MMAANALFAGMGLCIGLAHHRDPALSTLVSSSVRAGVNLLVLAPLAGFRISVLLGDRRPALWARGVAGALALTCHFAAIAKLGLGEAAFLNQTSAVWVALAAPWVLGERTHPLSWAAILGSLVGMGLLLQPGGAAIHSDGDWTGDALAAISGVFAAGAYLSVRRAAASNPPVTIVFYFTALAALLTTSAAWVEGVAWPRDPWIWLLLSLAGLAATAAQLAMTRAYQLGRAAPLAAAAAAGPLFSALLAWAALDEAPTPRGLLGMGVLLLSSIALPLTNALARP